MSNPVPSPIQTVLGIPSDLWPPIGIVGTLLIASIGGLFALLKYWKSRQIKEVSYSILSDIYLANIQEDLSTNNDIKVMVGSKKVQNVRFVVLRIRNSGNIPIKSEDYEVPLWFLEGSVFESGKLIAASVYDTEPKGIQATTSIDNYYNKVSVSKVLLNTGDQLFVNMLLSDYNEIIKVNGRIVGVKEIKQENFVPKQPKKFSQIIGQFVLVTFIIAILAAILSLPLFFVLHINFIVTTIIIFLTLSAIVLVIIGIGKIK